MDRRTQTEIEIFKINMQSTGCSLIFEDEELIVHQKNNNILLNPKYKMLERTPRTIVDEQNCFSLNIKQLESIMKNIGKKEK